MRSFFCVKGSKPFICIGRFSNRTSKPFFFFFFFFSCMCSFFSVENKTKIQKNVLLFSKSFRSSSRRVLRIGSDISRIKKNNTNISIRFTQIKTKKNLPAFVSPTFFLFHNPRSTFFHRFTAKISVSLAKHKK